MLQRLSFLLIGTVLLQAQTASQFEAASIKPNKSGALMIRVDTLPGGTFVAENVSVRSLLRLIYDVQDYQLAGGPSWIDSDRFDIQAKAKVEFPEMAGPFSGSPQLRGMLETLLMERFKLQAHREKRDGRSFTLTHARNDRKLGEKLTLAKIDCAAAQAKAGPMERVDGCSTRLSPGTLVVQGGPMSQLASLLAGFVGRPVLDATGLTGNYNLELQWTPPRPPGLPDVQGISQSDGPSLTTALSEQLGLKLEAGTSLIDTVVIDRIDVLLPN